MQIATTSQVSPVIALGEHGFNKDRYETYRFYRENEPVTWYEPANSWLIFRHDDISQLGRSTSVCTDHLVQAKLASGVGTNNPHLAEITNTISKWMIYNEAPVHTRLRTFMNRTFERENVEKIRLKIRGVVTALIEQLPLNGQMDFVSQIAHPVPAIILAQMIGLDELDLPTFLRWSDAIADFMQDFVVSPVPSETIAVNTAKNLIEMKAALKQAIVDRKAKPREDLLSTLAQSTSESPTSITEDELTLQLIHLIFGGHKIPQFILANTLHLLFQNPAYLAQNYLSKPENVAAIVEESMRYESPIQFITRHATQDFALRGKEIKQGDSLYLMLGSANRDASVYQQSDRFAPGMQGKRGIHYGTGHHVCIGAALASIEIGEILNAFLSCIKKVEPMYDLSAPQWTVNDTFHGITTMPLKVQRG